MKSSAIRSPFFYVGDKYKLMPQLLKLFPKKISNYIEPFAGGGSSFLNTYAKNYFINDIDYYVISLHKYLHSYTNLQEQFFEKLFEIIEKYNLSCSFKNKLAPSELKEKYPKTYYSHFNKLSYNQMKSDYNSTADNMLLYLLLIYGFNHMIRFNKNGEFNLPVGNVDFNKNVYSALNNYWKFMKKSKVHFYNLNYTDFLKKVKYDRDSFVYLDPPYLISGSEYNKLWNEKEEKKLCECLDELNSKGIKFGITNLVKHKGKENLIFLDWSKKYYSHNINSNYISFNDNTIKNSSQEVYVTNYGKK